MAALLTGATILAPFAGLAFGAAYFGRPVVTPFAVVVLLAVVVLDRLARPSGPPVADRSGPMRTEPTARTQAEDDGAAGNHGGGSADDLTARG